MILNADFIILNDGLSIEKTEKTNIYNNFPISSFWDMVDLKCEKCVRKKKIRPISMKKISGTRQTILRKNSF